MKDNANWRNSSFFMLLMCIVALLAASCGGNGGGLTADRSESNSGVTGEQRAESAPANLITQDEIASLPQWQQDLLNDPGWDQPDIPVRESTPMPAPSYEMLMEAYEASRAAGASTHEPRLGQEGSGKGASWNNQGGYTPPTPVNRGEYATAGAQPYGCVSGTTGGHAREDNIATEAYPQGANNSISYVLQGVTSANHFNTGGASGNHPGSAVYQLFASSRTADPTKDITEYVPGDPIPTFAERSYRADGGYGSPGPCDASVEAYLVRDFFWWRFNSTTNALPGGNSTPLYNILIAPRSNSSDLDTSVGNTDGRIQHFYGGSMSQCFGSGAIVGLFSSNSGCADFKNSVNDNATRFAWHIPIYGVLLKRWQDSVLDSMPPAADDPWDGSFGWPVQGPVPYKNGGSVLTGNGAYYAWGMYFERGFVWWIDYASNANAPDEAQAFEFTGNNVFCRGEDDSYVQLPTIFYGGSGPLGVSVVVEASLNPDRGPGTPPAGSYYEVGITDPNDPPSLDMHAHGYGGTADADCNYKHYTWAYRDGTIGQTNSTAFDNSTQYRQHVYTIPAVYTVRVQVVDANDNIAYGDSLPIHIGAGAGGGNAEIWIVRADDGNQNANLQALQDSLDAIGAAWTEVAYSSSVAEDYHASDAKVAIWYRGGPAGGGGYTAAWPAGQVAELTDMLNAGSNRKVLVMSQSHQSTTYVVGAGWSTYWQAFYGATGPTGGNVVNATEHARNLEGFQAGEGFGVFSPPYYLTSEAQSFQGAALQLAFGADGGNAAERYNGAGSSGKVPITFNLGSSQFSARARYIPFDPQYAGNINSTFTNGVGGAFNYGGVGFFGSSCMSYGTTTAPGVSGGTGRLWTCGYSWTDLAVTSGSGSPTKDDVLQNMLGWLDSSLTFSAQTNQGFVEYDGPPEIISITPAYWDEGPGTQMYRAGASSLTNGYVPGPGGPGTGGAGNYPDPTGTNAYRSTDNPLLDNEIITTDPNNDWLNGNDVDFQFPGWYAYVTDGGDTTIDWEGTTPFATDDSVFYGGLLVNDPDNSWARVNPPNPGEKPTIMYNEEENNVLDRNPMPVVAGYYVGSDTADEARAGYGTQMESFAANAQPDFNNNSRLTVESIAHWPQTLKYFDFAPFSAQDAVLQWALYPGQNMTVPTGPNMGAIIGVTGNWDLFRESFDIDPSHTVAGRTGSRWNRSSFSFTDTGNDGRVVEFNLRNLQSWNPDLNRDGTVDNDDKFPVRARLFTNHQAYFTKNQAGTSVWPNHLVNPGLDPAVNVVGARAESFIEGGAYIVDHGDAVYGLAVEDDPNNDDPDLTIAGGPGAYTVDLYFRIRFGQAPYQIDLDTDFDGTFVAETSVATAHGSNGFVNFPGVDIPGSQPDSPPLYTFRIRVIDANNDVAFFSWPNQVTLAPSFSVVILQDPLSQSPRAVQHLQNDLTFLYGAGGVTTINIGTSPLTPGSLDNYEGIFWCSDVAFASFGSAPPSPYGFTMGAGNANANEVINQVNNNGKTLMVMGGGAQGLSQTNLGSMGQLMGFVTQTWWFDGPGSPPTYDHGFDAGLQSIPNAVHGFDSWVAGSLGPAQQVQNMFTTTGTSTKNIEGYFTGAEFNYAAGVRRINLGPGLGKTEQVCFNYGDMAATQGGLNGNPQPRHKLLENIMCMGSFASPFNSTATP